MKEIKNAIVSVLQEGGKPYVELGKVIMETLDIYTVDYYVALNELKDEGTVIVDGNVYRLAETKKSTMGEIKAERLVRVLNSRLIRIMCSVITVKVAFDQGVIQACKARKQASSKLLAARIAIGRIDKIASAYKLDLNEVNGYFGNVEMIDDLFNFFNL